jgi:hypothetical protein
VAGEAVKAFVELRPGWEPSVALQLDIIRFARKRLGPAVAPRLLDFTSALPKTRSGKIVRRLQYLGFLIIMAGFLLQWPTLLTLLMFPVLVIVYVRLARKEERLMDVEFGAACAAYRRRVPGFIPRFGRRPAGTARNLQEGP